MASTPDASLPTQCGSWPELKAGYRLLNHEAVDPHAIQRPHRRLTHQSCGGHPIVLCVQDDTTLSFNHRGPVRGLGGLNDRGQVKRRARTAKVSIRFQAVQLEPPWNHPGPSQAEAVWAISVHEDRPPPDVEPIDWLLLTSEAVSTVADAQRIIGWYQHRWIIEEYHRVEKEGCRLEASQLDDAKDIQRLASIIGVISIRLLQLRDLAGCGEPSASGASGSADPQRLRRVVPMLWIQVVSRLAHVRAEELTPRHFRHAIARQGGWLARGSDGRPGWKVIWRGWYDVQNMVAGAALLHPRHQGPKKCG